MSSMFAYVCLGSNNLERSARFYDATLAVLGYRRCDTSAESESSWTGWIGWGLYERDGAVQDALWICKPYNGMPASVGNGGMLALRARNWRAVDDFHAAAIVHGGTSEGAPGLRLLYNPDFYAAYVRDPDGTSSRWSAGASPPPRDNDAAFQRSTSFPHPFVVKPRGGVRCG